MNRFCALTLFVTFWVTLFASVHPAPVEHRYRWKLTGEEILLELEDGTGHRGVYALDPFAREPRPVLLIAGGRRPVWNHRRTLFAYYYGNSKQVWIARRDGYTFALQWPIRTPDVSKDDDPPLRWTYSGNFYSVGRTVRMGTVVGEVFCLKPLPDDIDLRAWKHYAGGDFGHWLILAKPHDLSDIRNAEKVSWSDILVNRAQSFSPDDRHIAVEIAPAAPLDLRREQSRIFIYRNVYQNTPVNRNETPPQVFQKSTSIEGPIELGQRLTQLGEDVSELNPIWSPDGKWIAFTVIHWSKGYMTAAVCQQDGTNYHEITPAQELSEPARLVYQWLPVTRATREKATSFSFRTKRQWGYPHAMPVGWTDDGQYLVISWGSLLSSEPLAVAKFENGEWFVRVVPYVGPLSTTTPEDGLIAIGPAKNGRCPVAVCEIGGTGISILDLLAKHFREQLWINLPEGLTVNWIDW